MLRSTYFYWIFYGVASICLGPMKPMGEIWTFSLYARDWGGDSLINFPQDAFVRIGVCFAELDVYHFVSAYCLAIFEKSLDFPEEYRFFHLGKEGQYTFLWGKRCVFDQGDYLEFIGKRNDGTLDSALYGSPDLLPNPFYNTHNDTTAFFLTISPGQRGKRMDTASLPGGTEEISGYQQSALEHFAEQYSLGKIYFPGVRLSTYDEGQGWTSSIVTKGSSRSLNFSNLGEVIGDILPTLEISLVGRSETPHLTSIKVGPSSSSLRELGQYAFEDFQNRVFMEDLRVADFSPDGKLFISVTSLGVNNAVDNISVNYCKVVYRSKGISGDFEKEIFAFEEAEKILTIPGVSRDYVAYDVKEVGNPVKYELNRTGDFLQVPTGHQGRSGTVMVQSQNQVKEINVMRRVRFRNLLAQYANFLIISHELLRKPATNYGDPVGAYAAYRATPAGGAFDTLTVNVQELYDQFSYGEKSPLGIRNFLKEYNARHRPEYLLLIGRAYGMINTRRRAGVTYFYRNNPSLFDFQELVPAYGYPYSDNRFVVGLDPADPLGQNIGIGRIPARTPDDVGAYLDKIKEKDAMGVSEAWQKNIVHLSGGRSAFELERFFNFLNGFKAVAEDVYLGGNVQTVRKRSNKTTEYDNYIQYESMMECQSPSLAIGGHHRPQNIDIDLRSVNEMGYRKSVGNIPGIVINGRDAEMAYGDAYTFWGGSGL